MSHTFEEYRAKLDRISAGLRDDTHILTLMLLYVERQVPSCYALQHRLQLNLQCLFASIDKLWRQFSSRMLTASQLVAMKYDLFRLVSISDIPNARAASPTVGVALNTCDAVLKIVDFLLQHREDSLILCAQSCLEAVREEVYGELHRNLAAAKGSSWMLAERNSIEYANAIENIAQSAFSDKRTQAEVVAQLSLAEEIVRIPYGDRAALLETQKIALPDGMNSLGFSARTHL